MKQISHSDWLWALLSHERQLWLYYKAFHWYKGDCDTNYESLTTWCWYSGVFGWKYLVLQLVNNVVSGSDAWTWTDTNLCVRHNSVLGHRSLWYTDGWQYEKPKNIVIALGLHKHCSVWNKWSDHFNQFSNQTLCQSMNESVRILCIHEDYWVYGDILCEWILYCVSERFVYVDTLWHAWIF